MDFIQACFCLDRMPGNYLYVRRPVAGIGSCAFVIGPVDCDSRREPTWMLLAQRRCRICPGWYKENLVSDQLKMNDRPPASADFI